MASSKRRKEIILFALDVIFFVAALVPTMPVILRWFLWFSCWAMTIILLQMLFNRPRKIRDKIWVTAINALFFVAAFQSLALTQWREEKAATLEGDISADVEHSDSPPIL